MSRRSAWRLRLALLHAAGRSRLSGKMVLALASRFTTRGLIRREVLCAPQACYAFAEKWRDGFAGPWCGVVRELKCMAALVSQVAVRTACKADAGSSAKMPGGPTAAAALAEVTASLL